MTNEVYPVKSEKLAFTKTLSLTGEKLKVILITGGDAVMEFSGKKYSFARGSMACVLPLEYATLTAKASTAVLLEIPYAYVLPEVKKLIYGLNAKAVKVGEDDIPRLNDIFSGISYEAENDGKERETLINKYLFLLLAEFARKTPLKGEKDGSNISKALNFINEKFLSSPDLKDIASASGVTVNYFCALFKNKLGVNCNRYIKELKIRYAEKLLIVDGLKVQDTAKKCGYLSFSHFMSDFKSVTGITPNAFKKEFSTGG